MRAEYRDDPRVVFFRHLEDSAEARSLASLDHEALKAWIAARWLAPRT